MIVSSQGLNTIESDQIAFKASGRRSVLVDFPVSGTPLYFEKIKDHAVLEIRSKVKGDSGKLASQLGMLALLGLTIFLKMFYETQKRIRNRENENGVY